MQLQHKTFGPPPPDSHLSLSQLSRSSGVGTWCSTALQEEPDRRHRTGDFGEFNNISCQDFTRHVHSGVVVVMASSVVKRIPLIRFPARMKTPITPAATGSPASASSALGAESKTPPTAGVDAAGSTRPLHSTVPSQKPPAGGVA